MMTLMAQSFEITISMVVPFGLSGLVITNVGPIAFAQEETANKQLVEAMKALNSGDDAGRRGKLCRKPIIPYQRGQQRRK